MGYFFTLLFITTAYITPEVLFGELGRYHVETVLALLAILTSIPSLQGSRLFRLPQTYAVLALCAAVICSIAASGYLGGIPGAFYAFLPSVSAFLLAAVNCRRPWHLKLLVLTLVTCSTFYIVHGAMDLHNHVVPSPYLYGAEVLPRLRGLGFVNDPNDLSQVLVSLIPCVFFWRSRKWFANVFVIGIPVGILVTGMFLTHSRGAAIALMTIFAFTLRKKVGTIPAVVMGVLLLSGALAVGWSGGRDVSMEAGSDRLDAWSVGIQLIRSHPLFGVGFQRFSDFNDITAHNSVVVCAAEIGIPGFFVWVCLMLSTFRYGIALSKPQQAAAAALQPPLPQISSRTPAPAEIWRASVQSPATLPGLAHALPVQATSHIMQAAETLSLEAPTWIASGNTTALDTQQQLDELRRMAKLMIVSLIGFLAAGWFLSRALSMWLFLYCGIMCSLGRMALDLGIQVRTDNPALLARWSIGIGTALLTIVYVLLRVRSITGH